MPGDGCRFGTGKPETTGPSPRAQRLCAKSGFFPKEHVGPREPAKNSRANRQLSSRMRPHYRRADRFKRYHYRISLYIRWRTTPLHTGISKRGMAMDHELVSPESRPPAAKRWCAGCLTTSVVCGILAIVVMGVAGNRIDMASTILFGWLSVGFAAVAGVSFVVSMVALWIWNRNDVAMMTVGPTDPSRKPSTQIAPTT